MHSLQLLRKNSTCLALGTALLSLLLLPASLFGQGCVIARGGGGALIMDGNGYLEAGQWQLSADFRHFKSHRHFAGDDEQTHRSDNGTEVYNDSWFYDFSATYAFTKRWNATLTLPFVYHDRSSMYEHLGNNSGQRFATQSAGIADVRLTADYWIRDPNTHHRWNIAVGVGVKAPTGDAEARDIFVRPTGPQERYVDSSIQPGDGGWGYGVQIQSFGQLVGNWSFYANGFYLFNPDDRNDKTNFSIPDSYMARGGVSYRVESIKSVILSLGLRTEGVPGNDAFGSSAGSRRPGFATSVEPGITYAYKQFTATLTVPVAIHRARTTTYGQLKAGDAAFADYTINLSATLRL